MNVRVSYLTTTSGPSLWGAVGSLVVEPGNGRWLILRHVDPDRGPEGYLIADLVRDKIHKGTDGKPFPTEAAARAHVVRLAKERQ